MHGQTTLKLIWLFTIYTHVIFIHLHCQRNTSATW